jgi:Spindle and kinetochore-associated protein 2
MSHTLAAGMQSWVQALESTHRDLRVVSAQLEAEFERTYCHSGGASAAAGNPARLVARLAALETEVPAVADAMLLVARAELDATRTNRAAAEAAAADVALLEAITPQIGGGDSYEGEVDEGDELQGELERLCAQLATVASASTRANLKLIAAESKGTDEYLDKALLSAGIGSGDAEGDGDGCDSAFESGGNIVESEDSRAESRIASSGSVKAIASGAPANRKAVAAGRTKGTSPSSTRRKPNEKENAPATNRTNVGARGARAPDEGLQYASIAKPEYQRLPRMLKQQATLEQLNDVYAKVFELLSAHTAPMPEDELLAAVGEDSNKRIDVLRRGFSLLKRARDGWSLGKSAPPQTVGRSRPPLDQ